ncbi:hypothetical protein HDU93_006713 [Gonapodya sp. JEL0774]|nr:hypothetical protein HDU93_006713 [Gonapodya sp. JEL0774]
MQKTAKACAHLQTVVGVTPYELAAAYDVHLSTIYSWLERARGSPAPTYGPPNRSGRRTKCNPEIEAFVCDWMVADAARTQREAATMVLERFHVSVSQQTISNILKRNSVTRKKLSTVYSEQAGREEEVLTYKREMSAVHHEMWMAMDESGFKLNEVPHYGYSKRGTRATERKPNCFSANYSLLLTLRWTRNYYAPVAMETTDKALARAARHLLDPLPESPVVCWSLVKGSVNAVVFQEYLAKDLHQKGALALFSTLDQTAFADLVHDAALQRGLPPQTQAVGYVDASPLIYRLAATAMVAGTLEVWTGLFHLGENFTVEVKDHIVDRWANHYASKLYDTINATVPIDSPLINELHVFVERREARGFHNSSDVSQSGRTAFQRARSITKSASTWLSHMFKTLYHVPLYRPNADTLCCDPPPTLKTTVSHLARAGSRLPDWFLIPVVQRLAVLSGKIRIRMVEGIADEAAAAQAVLDIRPVVKFALSSDTDWLAAGVDGRFDLFFSPTSPRNERYPGLDGRPYWQETRSYLHADTVDIMAANREELRHVITRMIPTLDDLQSGRVSYPSYADTMQMEEWRSASRCNEPSRLEQHIAQTRQGSTGSDDIVSCRPGVLALCIQFCEKSGRDVPSYLKAHLGSRNTRSPSNHRTLTKRQVLDAARCVREKVARRRALKRLSYRTELGMQWTFVNFCRQAPQNVSAAVSGHIASADLLSLRNDTHFGMFLQYSMDGMTLDHFASMCKAVQIAIVQMYAYWKQPRVTANSRTWTDCVADLNKFSAIAPASDGEDVEITYPEAQNTFADVSTSNTKRKTTHIAEGDHEQVDKKRKRNATKLTEDEIKRLYMLVTIPMTTLDELLCLPDTLRRLIVDGLIPVHRRLVNAARIGCTSTLLVDLSIGRGSFITGSDLQKLFVDMYSETAKEEMLTSMAIDKPIQQFGKHFAGAVIGACKRALPRLSKLWLRAEIQKQVAGTSVRTDIVRGLIVLLNRVIAGFPGDWRSALQGQLNDADDRLAEGNDDNDFNNGDTVDIAVDGEDESDIEEARNALLQELAAKKDFTTDATRLKSRFERLFSGKRLTPAELSFRNTFNIDLVRGNSTKAWIAEMRRRFLHPTLLRSGLYPTDGGPTDMGKVVTDSTIGWVLQFVYDIDQFVVQSNPDSPRGIPQLLCPQPSFSGGFVSETATTFSAIVCEAIQIAVKARDNGDTVVNGVDVPSDTYKLIVAHVESRIASAIALGYEAMGLDEPAVNQTLSERVETYNAFRSKWLSADPTDPTGLYRSLQMGSDSNPMLHPMLIPNIIQKRGNISCSISVYTPAQPFLFFTFMPGAATYFGERWRRGQHLWFKHSFATDGLNVRLQAFDLNSYTSRKNAGYPVGGNNRSRKSRFTSRPADAFLYGIGLRPPNASCRPGTLRKSPQSPNIVPDRPFGTIPPQDDKIFMGPGTSGTRLFGKGHQYVKSKGICYLSKVPEWCHVGNQEYLEAAVRGRHVYALDLGRKSIAYGQFATLEITANGIVPKSIPVDISSSFKDKISGQTAGMNSANTDIQNQIKDAVVELSRASARTLDDTRYSDFTASAQVHGSVVLEHNCSPTQLGFRDNQHRQNQRFWLGEVNRVLALDDASHIQDRVDQVRKDFDGPWTDAVEAMIRTKVTMDLIAHPEVNAPILIIGDAPFAPQQRGHRGGTIGCAKKFIQMMTRFFFVVVVDEYMTSKAHTKPTLPQRHSPLEM